MASNILWVILSVGIAAVNSVHVNGKGPPSWDYGSKGPSTWANKYPTCVGKQQSPINVVTCETTKDYNSSVYTTNYWAKPKGTYEVMNNGHALQLNLPKDHTYRLKKAGNVYKALQVHIHFDTKSGKGSEHTLNSKKYFAEIHMVHVNIKYSVATNEFMKHPDGLLVVGFFVDITPSKKPSSYAMKIFGNAAPKITNPGSKVKVPAFRLGELFPTEIRKNSKLSYVNYSGSLTTPPCSQIVDWILYTGKVLTANSDVVSKLDKIVNSHDEPMSGNNRPVQDLFERDVIGVKL